MSEFVRFVIAELNRFVGRTNHSARRVVRLPLSVSLVNQRSNDKGQQNSMSGITCDLSKTGISFVVSSIHLGARHLFCDSECNLELKVQLPSGLVNMKAITVRYDVLSESEQGFVIGARIVSMDENERACYYKFLHTHSQKIQRPVQTKVSKPARAVT